MAHDEGVSVSLLAIREALERMKFHLDKQFNTQLPTEAKESYQRYLSTLSIFEKDPTAYKTIFNLMKDILPQKEYAEGTLGQKMLGCLLLENVPADIRVCLPGCSNSIPSFDLTECHYSVWKRHSVGDLVMIRDKPQATRCLVLTEQRAALTEAERKVLKETGIKEAKQVNMTNNEVAVTSFENVNAVVAKKKKAKDKSSVSTSGVIWITILAIVAILLVSWMNKRSKG